MQEPLPSSVRQWGMWCHLSSLLWIVVSVPFVSLLAPLIIWLLKREEHPFIDQQGKESVNFQISLGIYWTAFIVTFALGGLYWFGITLFIFATLLGVFSVIATIVAAIKASSGESYRYPFTLRFLK